MLVCTLHSYAKFKSKSADPPAKMTHTLTLPCDNNLEVHAATAHTICNTCSEKIPRLKDYSLTFPITEYNFCFPNQTPSYILGQTCFMLAFEDYEVMLMSSN